MGGRGVFVFTITVVVLDLTLCMVAIPVFYIGGGLMEAAFTRRRRRWELFSNGEEIDELDEEEVLLAALDEDESDSVPVGQLDGRRRRRWPFRRP